jgi:hypothetical protein
MKTFVSVIAVLAISSPLFASKGKTEVVAAPYQEVWAAALSMAADEFAISFASKADGVISVWHDKDVLISVLIVPVSATSTSLTFHQLDGEDQGYVRMMKGIKEKVGK